MAKRLAFNVTVDDEDGNSRTFGPGDSVPKEWAERITNPAAWTDEPLDADDGDVVGDLLPSDSTRLELLRAAERVGVEVPASASKEQITRAIRLKMFGGDTEAIEADYPLQVPQTGEAEAASPKRGRSRSSAASGNGE